MHSKEIAEVIHDIVILRWIIGINVTLFFGMLTLCTGLIWKFARDFKNDAIRRIEQIGKKICKEIDSIKKEVIDLDVCREENAGNIIRLQEDIKAVIQICKERHGK